MIENDDFKFRDDLYKPEAGDTIPIEILTGPFKGVIFRYIRIGVSEKENGEAVLRFQYELLQMGNYTETQIRSDQRFTNHIGILLNHLIIELSENTQNDIGENDPTQSSVESGLLP